MKINKNLVAVGSLSLLTTLISPVVSAHTGHAANESVHGLLHVEHIVALVAAGAIALAAFASRNR